MKIKMYQILQIIELCEKIKANNLPIKTSYKMIKLIRQLEPERKFYWEKVQEIINEYAEKDENSNPVVLEQNGGVKIKEGHIDKCQEELFNLMNLDVELADVYFLIDELESLSLSAQELEPLFPFIKEDNE